jgi:nicotinamide riboside kinase
VARSDSIRMSRIVGVIGAECSGKSTLAAALARALGGSLVPESLRSFVDRLGRVPTATEQAGVIQEQIAAERAAAERACWVISDGGVLMTAVYSALYYSDASLIELAVAHHRSAYAATLWCALDVPWRPDEGHRDGPEFRERAQVLLRHTLRDHPLRVLEVSGSPQVRLQAALAYLRGPGEAAG